MNPFRAQIWKHCLFSILMESQSLWKGKAIPFELQFYHNHWEGVGSPHQLSLRSLSIFLELSFSCSRAPLPISESQIFWERHISSFYLLWTGKKNLLWTIFPGVAMRLHWTFSLPLTFLLCPAKHSRDNGSKVPGFFAELCLGGLALASAMLCSITPLHHSKRKIEWVASLRVHP